MKKVINFVDKKELIIVTVLTFLIALTGLFATYAIDTSLSYNDTTEYDMSLNFDLSASTNKQVTIPAGKTKFFDIDVKNSNSGTIKYGIAYSMVTPSSLPSGVTIAKSWKSANPTSGLINANATLPVTIAVENTTSTDITISLSIINGYEKGGDLIVPTGKKLITGEYYAITPEPNAPALTDALIPVVYNESTSKWVKADSSNSNNSWYDYSNKIWANAVLVTSTNRSTYQSASAGTPIADADILAFYVWIPRYKYQVWNINKVIMTEDNYLYKAKTEGVDIVFEEGTDSTGTISCTYSYAAPSTEAGSPNETCTGSNGDYYTHPAFTFGTQELMGFWMGKFELSSETPNATNGGDSSTILTPRILPNVTPWSNNTVSNFWKVIYDMQTSNNVYGLPTSRTSVDSHMITNMEWGAVAYLTNSKYGRCTSGSCTEVSINGYGFFDSFATQTGCGPKSSGSVDFGTICNSYNTALGQTASTTGNVYGVYDMSGGADEYVAGNMSDANGTSYTYNVSYAGTNFTYSADTLKYLIPYAYGTTYNDQTAYNRGRLGDAVGEVVLTTGWNGGWYNDFPAFAYSDNAWIHRGGNFSTNYRGGVFYSNSYQGKEGFGYSTRATLSIAS